MNRRFTALDVGSYVTIQPSSTNVPRSLALVSATERYVFCGSKGSGAKSIIRCTASTGQNIGSKVSIGEAKGATYCNENNCFYVTAYNNKESTNVVYKVKSNWTTSHITFSHSVTGIAYDSSNGLFYLCDATNVYIYRYETVEAGGQIGRSNIIRQFAKGFTDDDGRSHHDLGAYGGIVLSCKSETNGTTSQTSYIDCYASEDGKYIKSFKIDKNGPLESVCVDSNGYLHLLFSKSNRLAKSLTVFDLSAGTGGEDEGPNGAQAINEKAIELAWPASTPSSTYTSRPTDAYKEALDKYYANHDNWGQYSKDGMSCDVFVGTVLRACGYDSGASRALDTQLQQIPTSKNLYTVTKYSGAPSSTDAVQPGDIVMYKNNNGTGHIMIIVSVNGKKAIAEASYGKKYGYINTSIGKVTKTSYGGKTKEYTYVCRPSGTVKDMYGEQHIVKQYVEGFSYGGGITQLYSSGNYEHVFKQDEQDLLNKLSGEKISYLYNQLKNLPKSKLVINEPLSDDVVIETETSPAVRNYKLNLAKPSIYKDQKNANNLISAESMVQAPYIMVDFNGTKIGGVGNSGDRYPNYLNEVSINRINGQINTYTINISYQVRPNEDANFIDKLISQCGYTNPIKIEYGDANSPSASYREESALITDVNYSEDITSYTINYTIKALSSIAVATGSLKNYASTTVKPSTAIYDLIYNSGDTSRYIQEAFPGLKNKSLVSSSNLIPTNDKPVTLAPQLNMDPLSYLAFLVSCMNNETGKKSSYYLAFYDDTHGKFGGPYLKIQEVTNYGDSNNIDALANVDFYEVDVGYPTDNMITDFSISTNQYWGQVYEYNEKIPSYRYGIDDNGNILATKTNKLLSDNQFLTESLTTSNWWRDATEFPISAKLTLKGTLRPIMLMSYIRVNAQFYGQRDLASGIYVVTAQDDVVSRNGFFTTLTLLRVAGDNPGLT